MWTGQNPDIFYPVGASPSEVLYREYSRRRREQRYCLFMLFGLQFKSLKWMDELEALQVKCQIVSWIELAGQFCQWNSYWRRLAIKFCVLHLHEPKIALQISWRNEGETAKSAYGGRANSSSIWRIPMDVEIFESAKKNLRNKKNCGYFWMRPE